MSGFQTVTLTQNGIDVSKRVNYSLGLVLGVDEFQQEQTYFLERDRLHNRSLHGYGTVHGLQVSSRAGNSGPEILVSSGLAVDPLGREIRISEDQCAKLNEWLSSHQAKLDENQGSPPAGGPTSLYVVLCYRECETDMVPIPGGPCRTEEESIAASRIADDFELALRLNPPDTLPNQVEEKMVRKFGDLLGRIEITTEAPNFQEQEDMEALVRGLLKGPVKKIVADIPRPIVLPERPGDLIIEPDLGDRVPVELPGPKPGIGVLPAEKPLYLHPDRACTILHAAFRVWVTEVRPVLVARQVESGHVSPDQACVLLAELQFQLDAVDKVQGEISIVEDERPILLHTRLMQEWLLCGNLARTDGIGTTHTFASLFGKDQTTIRAWIHHPALLNITAQAVTVTVNGAAVGLTQIKRLFAGVNVFDLSLDSNLSDGDRLALSFDAGAIELANGSGETLLETLDGFAYDYLDQEAGQLLAYLIVEQHALDDLIDVNAPTATNGQVLTWDQASAEWQAQSLPPIPDELNDLNDVTAEPNNSGEVLTWDEANGLWIAKPSAAAVQDLNDLNNVKTTPTHGDVLTYDQELGLWVAGTVEGGGGVSGPAGGDLSGVYPNPTVVRLQNRPVSNIAPSPNAVLAWNGARWTPTAVPYEPDLTRIVALSWSNDTTSLLDFNLDGEQVKALAVAFGKKDLDDDGVVIRKTVTDDTFQVYFDQQLEFGFRQCFRIQPIEIVPIVPLKIDERGRIVAGERAPTADLIKAVAFVVDPEQFEPLVGRKLRIVLKGNFILDDTERAIDAEHVRGQLPTGDRPTGNEYGLQGGIFESWILIGEGRLLDINKATLAELEALPGIGDTLAERIVIRREELGGYRSTDELLSVSGIGESLLTEIRPLITYSG